MTFKIFKYILIGTLALFFYIATAIPLGIYIYSLKSEKGINLFQSTGVHSYIHCLRQEAQKAQIEIKNNK